jgi:RNA polymerase sigma-70 factor (ECF subfamily)
MRLRRNLRDRRQASLLRQAVAGNARAFRRLYRDLYGPLLRYLCARTKRVEDAEDILSRVFHRFLERLPHFDGERGSVFAWLQTMARNALIDDYRARREMQPLDGLAEVLAGGVDPLDSLIRSEEAERVLAWLGARSPETREMFTLRYGQGLRYREIAECLGVTEVMVKQRFSRSLRELRREFGSRDEKEGEVDYAVR